MMFSRSLLRSTAQSRESGTSSKYWAVEARWLLLNLQREVGLRGGLFSWDMISCHCLFGRRNLVNVYNSC